MSNELLERGFEKLHGIKWADTTFSVRACWTDAWLTATAHEREACAKVCDDADKSTHPSDLADRIRMRSNGSGNPTTEAAKPL